MNRTSLAVKVEMAVFSYIVCRHRVDPIVIQLLIELNPDAVRAVDLKGMLALHAALDGFATQHQESVELLLSHFPDAVQISDVKGKLPLHYALKSLWMSEETIMNLLDLFPQGAKQLTSDEDSALHLSVCLRGMTPMTATTPISMGVLHRLVEIYPYGVLLPNSRGWLPLHSACVRPYDSSLEVVRFMFEQCPVAIRIRDREGDLPLHLAVSIAPFHVVQFLVEKYPEAVMEKGSDGWLPLHDAAERFDDDGSEFEKLLIVKLLIDRYNGPADHCNGLKVLDASGNLPLHCAAGRDVSLETVRAQWLTRNHQHRQYVWPFPMALRMPRGGYGHWFPSYSSRG